MANTIRFMAIFVVMAGLIVLGAVILTIPWQFTPMAMLMGILLALLLILIAGLLMTYRVLGCADRWSSCGPSDQSDLPLAHHSGYSAQLWAHSMLAAK
jgi:hypothetical protein